MNNYTGFNFLPSPTRPVLKVRHVADAVAMPSASATDDVVEHTMATDRVFLLVSGQT